MASSSNNAGPPPNPCRYQLNGQTSFFLCRRCRTPVLDSDNFLGLIKGEMDGLLCYNAFNVRTHDAIHRFSYQLPINNVRCNDCSKHIGEKFIVVGDNDPPPPRPYPLEGKVFFYADRLLFWNRKRFLDADSDQLVKRLIYFDGTQLRYCDTYLNEETNNGTDDETETDGDAGTDDETESDEEAESGVVDDDETETDAETETDGEAETETDEEAESEVINETNEVHETDEETESDDETDDETDDEDSE